MHLILFLHYYMFMYIYMHIHLLSYAKMLILECIYGYSKYDLGSQYIIMNYIISMISEVARHCVLI